MEVRVATIIFHLLLISVMGEEYAYDYNYDTQYEESAVYSEEDRPTFLDQPQEFTVKVGDPVTFPCNVEKTDFVMTFSHIAGSARRGSKSLYFAAESAVRKAPRFRKDGNNFVVSAVRRADAGLYICRIETKLPVELQHKLIVQYAPKVSVVGPTHRSVEQGAVLELQCSAEGVPQPSIVWRRLGADMPHGTASDQGYLLAVTPVNRHTEGTYTCTATNGVGEPSSATVTVTVEYPPEVAAKQDMIHGGDGDTVNLSCIVEGNPAPEVYWYRGDRLASQPGKHVTSQDLSTHTHTLAVHDISEADFGRYSCNASNSQGSTGAVIRLTGLPGTPYMTSSPSGGEPTTYTITWETESTAPLLQYRLRYRERTANGTILHGPGHWHDSLYSPKLALQQGLVHRAAAVRGSTDSRSHGGRSLETQQATEGQQIPGDRIRPMAHPLDRLDPATQYQATVQVENKFGWSHPSHIFYFHTKREVAVGQAATSTSSASHITAPHLLWTLALPALSHLWRTLPHPAFRWR